MRCDRVRPLLEIAVFCVQDLNLLRSLIRKEVRKPVLCFIRGLKRRFRCVSVSQRSFPSLWGGDSSLRSRLQDVLLQFLQGYHDSRVLFLTLSAGRVGSVRHVQVVERLSSLVKRSLEGGKHHVSKRWVLLLVYSTGLVGTDVLFALSLE